MFHLQDSLEGTYYKFQARNHISSHLFQPFRLTGQEGKLRASAFLSPENGVLVLDTVSKFSFASGQVLVKTWAIRPALFFPISCRSDRTVKG